MTEDQINEGRIREALRAEAERVVPHAHAHVENMRRLAAARRRHHLFVPVAAAVALATALPATFTVLHRQPPSTPPAAPVGDLDPRYRPAGPMIDAGAGVSMWLTGDGLCWRQAAGGGDCRSAPAVPPGGVTAIGVRAATYAFNGRQDGHTVIYGVAGADVTTVELVNGDGTRTAGQIFSGPGLSRKVWQATVPKPKAGRPSVDLTGGLIFSKGAVGGTVRLSAVQAIAQNQAAARRPPDGVTIHRLAPWSPTSMPAPRPLTQGAPLFRFGSPDRADNTMHVYVDGPVVGFGTGTSTPALLGSGGRFGTLFSLTEGTDVPWWYGFMGTRMTRVQARLRDGRVLTADTVKAGSHRAFAVRLTHVPANARGGTVGYLVGLDSAGKVLERVAL